MRRIDHTGKRFGKLVVEEMMYGYRHKKTYAKCRCDCGNETDEIKRKYCDSKNIVLMCLPYTLSRQEVRTKVLSILNPCND